MEANEVKETQETTVEETVVQEEPKFAKLKAWWNRNKTHVRDVALGAAAVGGIVVVSMLSRGSDSDYTTEEDYKLEYSSNEPLEIESNSDSDTEEATE